MSRTRTFLRVRQVRSAVLAVLAAGVLVALFGDRAMLLPGAEVPVVFGLVGPVLGVGACVMTFDAALPEAADLERTAPRPLGRCRVLLLCVVASTGAGALLVAGWLSMGLAAATTLARDLAILLGPAVLVWAVSGPGAAVGTAGVLAVGCAYLGRHGAAPGDLWARWAVLMAGPGETAAAAAAACGLAVAIAAAGVRDRARDRWRSLRASTAARSSGSTGAGGGPCAAGPR